MLQSKILPTVGQLNIVDRFHLWFQQDGAPAHYCQNVRNCLNQTFPGRWIGRGGPVEWPPRSPDLSPMDFFLWGYLKSKIYRIPLQNLDELKESIRNCMNEIPKTVLVKVQYECIRRMVLCMQQDGKHFEHILDST